MFFNVANASIFDAGSTNQHPSGLFGDNSGANGNQQQSGLFGSNSSGGKLRSNPADWTQLDFGHGSSRADQSWVCNVYLINNTGENLSIMVPHYTYDSTPGIEHMVINSVEVTVNAHSSLAFDGDMPCNFGVDTPDNDNNWGYVKIGGDGFELHGYGSGDACWGLYTSDGTYFYIEHDKTRRDHFTAEIATGAGAYFFDFCVQRPDTTGYSELTKVYIVVSPGMKYGDFYFDPEGNSGSSAKRPKLHGGNASQMQTNPGANGQNQSSSSELFH